MSAKDLVFPILDVTPQGAPFSVNTGLSKRELFAAMAMQGLVSTLSTGAHKNGMFDATAETAVRYADALMAALEETAP